MEEETDGRDWPGEEVETKERDATDRRALHYMEFFFLFEKGISFH
jgi:hypothetical protein